MAFRLRVLGCALALLSLGIPAFADSTTFDLTGPTLEATVTRGKARLPIAEVPNLQAGDRVWIQANLPASQSVHYLMVVAFLRGSTNPPPDNWFHQDETWKSRGSEGLQLTVPKGAKQMLVLLAPQSAGAYRTLVNAVQRKPGSFVRASQDLNEAMLDRARLDTYLTSIKQVNVSDPTKLQAVAPLLARSLSIKLDNTCFDAVSEEQAPCLMHNQNSLVMGDGQSESITGTLTSGAVSDLAMQVSATPRAGMGYYSPYISSVMDMARIMESFRSPQYQYIPALTMRKAKAMHLMLNTPPSFGSQKSVIVAAMPAIEPSQPPLLHGVAGSQSYCAEQSELVLPADGAPLVYATGYAHDMELRLKTKSGRAVNLPARADAKKGGFIIDTAGLNPAQFGNTVQASLQGYWGFAPYNGPEYTLENAHSQSWLPAAGEADNLVVGSDQTIHLNAENAACVEKVTLKNGSTTANAKWKRVKPGELEVTLPLTSAKPGNLTLAVSQFGLKQAETVTLRSFAKPATLTSFALHAGDTTGVLQGSMLVEVASLDLNGVRFVAGKPDAGSLTMTVANKKQAQTLTEGSGEAHVRLKDGRMLTVATTIEAPRPQVKLLAKSVDPARHEHSNIQLADANELPQTATLRFSVKAETPANFSRGETLEVATADKVFTTTLTLQNGGLTLQDMQTAVATLRPAKAFGESAFGPLVFRVVDNGVAGAWQPLATLVRLPKLETLKCSGTTDSTGSPSITDAAAVAGTASPTCELTGENMFLVDAVASDPGFQNAVQVPDGFPGDTLAVPQPTATGQLYVKLRDDPTAVNIVALKLPPPPKPKAAPVPVPSPVVAKKPLLVNPGGPMIPASQPTPQTGSAGATGTQPKPAAGNTPAATGANPGTPAAGNAAAAPNSATAQPKAGSPTAEPANSQPQTETAASKPGTSAQNQ